MRIGSAMWRSTGGRTVAALARHARSSAAAAVLAAVLAACGGGGVAGEPWDAEVEEATSATDWGDLEPIGVGPEGRGVSGDAIVGQLTQMVMGMYPGSTIDATSLLDRDPPIVFIRSSTAADVPHPMRAVDVLVELRQTDAGLWIVDAMRERFHCAAAVATRFCE